MYLLFDIGGTNTRIAISKDHHTIEGSKIIHTDPMYETGSKALIQTAGELAGDTKITKIAGGIAGALDRQKSQLLNGPNLPDWNHKPLKVLLQTQFAGPVYLENDTALGGLGEAVYGGGQDHAIVAYLAIGTGIGGCRIVQSKIDQSAWGFEPGHQYITVNPSQPAADLEDLISGHALEKRFGKKSAELSEAAWDEVATYLGYALNNIIVLWSPDIILLGGSVMRSLRLEPVLQATRKAVKIFQDIPPVELALLQDVSGIYGALAYLNNMT